MSSHTFYKRNKVKKINEIENRNELADFLGVGRGALAYILYKKPIDNCYVSFEIPKKDGSNRCISAPNEELKYIQKRLALKLEEHINVCCNNSNRVICSAAHGFIKGRSIISNAEVHRNKKFILNVDLSNFFDSFHFGRVLGYFQKNRMFLLPKEVAVTIAQLVCFNGKLPQGAPTSPIITNLICNILDYRVIKLAQKYRLAYTRYADDLTFSTNDKNIVANLDQFLAELNQIIIKAGFSINSKKTRFVYKNSRQEVTGLVVNNMLHVNRDYYKTTRAMAHALYKNGKFNIDDGVEGTINQLEGRLNFINQLEKYNNKRGSFKGKKNINGLNGREKEYSKFLFFKYFYNNSKPIILTEGKTDILYLKAALKNLYLKYPQLIERKENGEYVFKIAFYKKTKINSFMLKIERDGADTMRNFYLNFYLSRNSKGAIYNVDYFNTLSNKPANNAVLILFDNEFSDTEKPISKFFKNDKRLDSNKSEIKERYWTHIYHNLYVSMVPNQSKLDCADIETLFDDSTLSMKCNGKSFSKKESYDTEQFYGKDRFSKLVMQNYKEIDFSKFIPLLDNVVDVINDYNTSRALAYKVEGGDKV